MDPLRVAAPTPIVIQQPFIPSFTTESEAIPHDQVDLSCSPAPRRARRGEASHGTGQAQGVSEQERNKISNDEAAFVNSALNPRNRKYPDTEEAIAKGLNKVQVMDQGVVEKVFPDDTSGLKHQLFTLRMGSGKVVRIAHNYELAGKIPDLRQGLSLAVKGEFINKDNMSAQMAEILGDGYFLFGDDIFSSTNSKGIDGLIHWTHKPTGSNPSHDGGGFVILTKGDHYHKVIA